MLRPLCSPCFLLSLNHNIEVNRNIHSEHICVGEEPSQYGPRRLLQASTQAQGSGDQPAEEQIDAHQGTKRAVKRRAKKAIGKSRPVRLFPSESIRRPRPGPRWHPEPTPLAGKEYLRPLRPQYRWLSRPRRHQARGYGQLSLPTTVCTPLGLRWKWRGRGCRCSQVQDAILGMSSSAGIYPFRARGSLTGSSGM